MDISKEWLWALMAAVETVFSMVTDLVGSPGAPRGVPTIGAVGRSPCTRVIKLGNKGSHHQLCKGSLQTRIVVND